MFKIPELPEYIQSFLGHLIVKDDKKKHFIGYSIEKDGKQVEYYDESYYVFSPEIIKWADDFKNKYSNYPSILQTCNELSSVSLYNTHCDSEFAPYEESFKLRFTIRNMLYPLHLSVIIDDYLTANKIEGYHPSSVSIGCNRFEPTYMELYFCNKNKTE